MSEVSNKTLATLLIATIVVSLGGTLISLNKLGGMSGITGHQVTEDLEESGTIYFDYDSIVAINITDDSILIGNISLISSSDNGTCETDGTATSNVQFRGSTNCGSYDAFTLDNVGTLTANVSVKVDGDADPIICDSADEDYAACAAGTSIAYTTDDYQNVCDDDQTDTELTTSDQDFCNNFDIDSQVNMTVLLTINKEATGGSDSDIVATFTAQAAS